MNLLLVTNVTQMGVKMINTVKLLLFLYAVSFVMGQETNTISGQGKVTYLTADQVYCDIGTSQGITIGDTLQLFRRAEGLGDMVISHSAKNSSVCIPLIPIENIQLGDRVQFEKMVIIINEPVIEPELVVPEKTRKQKKKMSHAGNVSIRSTIQSLPNGISEKKGIGTLQYRLKIPAIKQLKVGIYGRSDLQNQKFTLYQARASFGSKHKEPYFQLGRVFASELSGIGATDGLLATTPILNNLILGGLGGFQPNPESYQFNSDIKKFGLFSKVKIPSQHFSGSVAFVGQYAGPGIDREFIYSKLSYNPIKQFSAKLYQTFDYYRNEPIYNRDKLESTFSQLSLKFKFGHRLTLRTRYTSRQQIIYQQSQVLVPDSLFQSELKNGWYNSLKWQTTHWGTIQIGSNFRKESDSENFSTVHSLYYRSKPFQKGISIDLNSIMIQNQLLTGIQNKFGFSIPFKENGFLHAEIDIYTFGFGQNWNDYLQQTFSASISKKVNHHLNTYMSIDISKDADYVRMFGYFGLTYRF